jgi:hypothetical protein
MGFIGRLAWALAGAALGVAVHAHARIKKLEARVEELKEGTASSLFSGTRQGCRSVKRPPRLRWCARDED